MADAQLTDSDRQQFIGIFKDQSFYKEPAPEQRKRLLSLGVFKAIPESQRNEVADQLLSQKDEIQKALMPPPAVTGPPPAVTGPPPAVTGPPPADQEGLIAKGARLATTPFTQMIGQRISARQVPYTVQGVVSEYNKEHPINPNAPNWAKNTRTALDVGSEQAAGLLDAIQTPLGALTAGIGPKLRALPWQDASKLLKIGKQIESAVRLGFAADQIKDAVSAFSDAITDPNARNISTAVSKAALAMGLATPEIRNKINSMAKTGSLPEPKVVPEAAKSAKDYGVPKDTHFDAKSLPNEDLQKKTLEYTQKADELNRLRKFNESAGGSLEQFRTKINELHDQRAQLVLDPDANPKDIAKVDAQIKSMEQRYKDIHNIVAENHKKIEQHKADNVEGHARLYSDEAARRRATPNKPKPGSPAKLLSAAPPPKPRTGPTAGPSGEPIPMGEAQPTKFKSVFDNILPATAEPPQIEAPKQQEGPIPQGGAVRPPVEFTPQVEAGQPQQAIPQAPARPQIEGQVEQPPQDRTPEGAIRAPASLTGAKQLKAGPPVYGEQAGRDLQQRYPDRPVVGKEPVKRTAKPPEPPKPEEKEVGENGEPPVKEGFTRLYRGQAEKGGNAPDWVKDSPKYQASKKAEGRWFAKTKEQADWYVKDAGETGHMTYIDVPTADVAKYSVKNSPEALKYSIDPENEYFVPDELKGKAQKLQKKTEEPSTSRQEPKAGEEKNKVFLQEGTVTEMPREDIHVDPKRFQFKSDAIGKGGVTDKLKDVEFDPKQAGALTVWKDPKDNKTYVINGHHRLERANAANYDKPIHVQYIAAEDAAEARTKGALMNVNEGNGKPIDVAKIFRQGKFTPADLKQFNISRNSPLAKQGFALANLNDQVFEDVATGKIPEGKAVAIGEMLDKPADQKAAAKLAIDSEGKGITPSEFRETLGFIKNGPKRTETKQDLFGSYEVEKNLYFEKGEISDYIKNQLATEKRLFGSVAKEKNASKLGDAGNTINASANADRSQQAAQALDVYNKLKNMSGPVADILDSAAKELAEGGKPGDVKARAYQRIFQQLGSDLHSFFGGAKEKVRGGDEDTKQSGSVPLSNGVRSSGQRGLGLEKDVEKFNEERGKTTQQAEMQAKLNSKMGLGDKGNVVEKASPLFTGKPIDNSPPQASMFGEEKSASRRTGTPPKAPRPSEKQLVETIRKQQPSGAISAVELRKLFPNLSKKELDELIVELVKSGKASPLTHPGGYISEEEKKIAIHDPRKVVAGAGGNSLPEERYFTGIALK